MERRPCRVTAEVRTALVAIQFAADEVTSHDVWIDF